MLTNLCYNNRRYPKAIVADFGCGEAKLAENVKNKVYSFDLVSRKPHVIACNIAKVRFSCKTLVKDRLRSFLCSGAFR